MSQVIQIKRNTENNNEPTGLLPGELAYVEGTNKLYIGTTSEIKEIKPEFLTYATNSSSDEIILNNSGSNKYTLSVADSLPASVGYILPPDIPVSKKIVTSTVSGQLQYDDVTIDTLESIGDVEDDPEANEILIYENGEWVGELPSNLLENLNLGIDSNQIFENLHLLGNLEVKGDSVQLNSANLAIRDKLIGVGVTKGTIRVTAHQSTNTVTILSTESDIGSLSDGDWIFVGDGYTDPANDGNIPSGYYQINVLGGGDIQFTSTGADTPSTGFELVISEVSSDVEIDGAGLVFPGTTKKSLLWKDEVDRFELTGGDLKVSGDEVYLTTTNGEEKIIDNNDSGEKTITGFDIPIEQITGSFDGGDYS